MDDSLGWRGKFAGGLDVVPLDGDHLSIFGADFPDPNLSASVNKAIWRNVRA